MNDIKYQVPIKVNYWGETEEDFSNLPTMTTEGKGEYLGMGCAPENSVAFILYSTGLRFYQLNINGWIDITADILRTTGSAGSGSGEFDIDALTPEQIAQLKEIINEDDFDIDNLTSEQITKLKILLELPEGDIPILTDDQVEELIQIIDNA